MQIWESLPAALLVLRGPAQEARGAGPGRAPDGHGHRGQAAAGPVPVRRRRQGDVPCLRRHLALAVPSGRPVFRTVLGPGHPVPGPVEAGRASARPRSRPTAAATSVGSRSSFASVSPIPVWHRPSGDVTVQVERNGLSPAQAGAEPGAGTRNVFEGALPQAPEGDYEVRLLPPPILDGPIPTATLSRRGPGQRVRAQCR